MASRLKYCRHAPEEVDRYLASLPDNVRSELVRVRGIIREIVPDCTERVSYQVPVFRLGTDLVGLSTRKNYCSLHSMSMLLLKRLSGDLTDVKVYGTTIQFTPENPLPRALIERVVYARLAEISAC